MKRSLIPALLLTALLTPTVRAQSVPLDVTSLADSSAVILAGRVERLQVSADAGLIYTYATVSVGTVYKGESSPAATVVVKQLGGTLPDVGLYIADQARFAVGEEVLLFLAIRPRDRSLYTAGLSAGKWRVYPDLATGHPVAVRNDMRLPLDESFGAAAGRSRADRQPFVATPREATLAAPAFALIPESEGGPARWHEADDGARIPIDFQNVPSGLPGNGISQLDSAISAWNGVNSRLVLQRAGSGSPTCPAASFTGDGRIGLYWDDPCGEIGDGDTTTFGVGGGFFTPGFQKTINGVTFNKFLQGIAILNNVGPHLTTAACLTDAVTHVLGHAVGLGHASDGGAVMFATLRSGCSSGASGLASDDTNGLRFVYPAIASGGSAPGAPTAIANSVVLDAVTLSWTPAATGGAAQSYLIEAGSAPGLANIATLVVNSSATSTVVGAVPTGQYHVRVRARNALGTSAPSPDTVVTVGPCSAPGVPTGLSYTAADNVVNLSWTPPPGGVTQGYWLFAGYAPGQSNALVQALGPAPAFTGVAPFGTYYVRVAARNSCATSATTADLTVTVQPCTAVPGAATGLTFTRSGNLVTLSWTAPTTDNLPSRYQIHAGSAPGASNLLIYMSPTSTTAFQATAPPGRYFVRVLGQNNCGVSGPSNEVDVVVP